MSKSNNLNGNVSDGFLNDEIVKKNVKTAPRKRFTKREYLEFKLKICQKYCQVHPFIVINQPDAVRCMVCCEATYDSAVVSFMDRKADKTEKQFTIDRVCVDCLDKAGLVHVTRNQIARYVVLQRGHVLMKTDGVSEDKKCCFLCRSNTQIPTGTIRIKIKGMFIDVPLCEKHMLKCLVDKSIQKKITEDEQTLKEIEEFSNSVDVPLSKDEWSNEVKKFNEGYSMAAPVTMTDEVDAEFEDVKSFMKEDE